MAVLSLSGAALLLVLCCAAYILIRRARHGGLAGGSGFPSPPFTPSASGHGKMFTKQEVAKHNKQDDLWLIINGKVYDFTDYVMLHPGGEAIFRNAGADSTSGFLGSQHPARVHDMINDFYIGKLVEYELDDKKLD